MFSITSAASTSASASAPAPAAADRLKNGCTWVMERSAGSLTIREQCKAWSVSGIISVIRAYRMANLGWEVADLPYNDYVKSILSRSGVSISEI